MTNWIYGTIRIKGPVENILDFLNNGLEVQSESPVKHRFFLNDDKEIDSFQIDDCTLMYVSDSSRHFIEIDYDLIYYEEDGTIECELSYEAAWSIDRKTIEYISSFGLYVSIYGDEWGMNFAQRIVCENGELLNISLRNLNRKDHIIEFPDEIKDTDEEERNIMLSEVNESGLF